MRRMYEVRMILWVSGGDPAESFTRVADAHALEAVGESLLDASFGFSAHDDNSAHVDVEITVAAEDDDAAFALATSSVQAAIQTAGGVTPDWESAVTVYRLAGESVGLVGRPRGWRPVPGVE